MVTQFDAQMLPYQTGHQTMFLEPIVLLYYKKSYESHSRGPRGQILYPYWYQVKRKYYEILKCKQIFDRPFCIHKCLPVSFNGFSKRVGLQEGTIILQGWLGDLHLNIHGRISKDLPQHAEDLQYGMKYQQLFKTRRQRVSLWENSGTMLIGNITNLSNSAKH